MNSRRRVKGRKELYFINTDKLDGPGKHWCIGVMLDGNDEMEFFDSYGLPPKFYGLDRLFPKCGKLRVNTRTVQCWDSLTCGHHCLFYSYFRTRGVPMDSIMNLYSDDLKKNDEMVLEFVMQHGSMYAIRKRRR